MAAKAKYSKKLFFNNLSYPLKLLIDFKRAHSCMLYTSVKSHGVCIAEKLRFGVRFHVLEIRELDQLFSGNRNIRH